MPQNCHLYTPQKRRDFTSAAVCFQAENMAVSEGLFFSFIFFFFCKIYLSRIVGRVHILLLFFFRLHSALHSQSHTTTPQGCQFNHSILSHFLELQGAAFLKKKTLATSGLESVYHSFSMPSFPCFLGILPGMCDNKPSSCQNVRSPPPGCF